MSPRCPCRTLGTLLDFLNTVDSVCLSGDPLSAYTGISPARTQVIASTDGDRKTCNPSGPTWQVCGNGFRAGSTNAAGSHRTPQACGLRSSALGRQSEVTNHMADGALTSRP